MKYTNVFKTVLIASLLASGVDAARAGTIQQGITSTTTASPPGSAVAGTVDSAYVTAVLGTNAYIQDGTGGIYVFGGSRSGNALNGLTIGTLLMTLGNGSFQYFGSGMQFEYTTPNSSTNLTLVSSSPGNVTSIPASYYTTVRTVDLNSATNQGDAANQGIQNQLVTLNNVVITAIGTASQTVFTPNSSYTLTDSFGTATLFVNAASGVANTAVPVGTASVSGVFQDFHGTSELIPRGAFDVVVVPEPGTSALVMALVAVAGLLGFRRSRKA